MSGPDRGMHPRSPRNETYLIDLTCCGAVVQQLKLVNLHSDGTPTGRWFLAPDPSYHLVDVNDYPPGRYLENLDGTIRDLESLGEPHILGLGDDASRGRYRFTCAKCGADIPADADTLRTAAETLRLNNVTSWNLRELPRILKLS